MFAVTKLISSFFAQVSAEAQRKNGNGSFSESIESINGVMQGDLMTSVLFLLFINDVEEYLKELTLEYAPSLHRT